MFVNSVEAVGVEYSDKVHTIFCSKMSQRNLTLLRHGMIVLLLGFIVFSIVYIYRNRREHPIKQRTPKLTIVHLGVILIYISLLYYLEWSGLISWKVKRIEDIPISRLFAKTLVYALRSCIPTAFALKPLVIYFQWKLHSASPTYAKILASETNSIIIYFAVMLVLLSVGLLSGYQPIGLYYPSLNWFDPTRRFEYKYSSLGLYNIMEFLLILVLLYLVRNFPDTFRVKMEIGMVFASFFVTCNIASVLNPMGLGDGSSRCDQTIPPYFTQQFLFEYIRTCAMVVSIYTFNRVTYTIPPIPTKQLHNFKIFISSAECRKVFLYYLYSANQEAARAQFEDFMLSEIEKSSKNNQSKSSSGFSSSSSSGIPSELYDAFCDYQDTYSFEKLKAKLEEYEAIFHLRFKQVIS